MTRKFFGTDGIRDHAGQGMLAPEQVRRIGRALGRFLSSRRGSASRVLVGRDTRESGPQILTELSAGLLDAGHHLIDGGVLPTPAVQTLCRLERFDLAIVISASHNPAHDNGIKFFGPDGRKLPDEAELALEELMHADEDAAEAPAGERGRVEHDPEAAERYLASLSAAFPDLDLTGVRVVLDCAHGAASAIGARAYESFGATVRCVGNRPDGTNINAGAGVFHVAELGPLVEQTGSQLGLSLDGDADRVLLVDDRGEVRDGDHMLGVLALDLRDRGALPESRLVTTVMANMGLFAWCKEHDLTCERVPVGDRFVAERMAQTGALLGGEQSGHVIFRRGDAWHGDGLFTGLMILDVLQRTEKPLSQLVQGLEKFPQRLENIRVLEKPPVESVPALVVALRHIEERLGEDGRVVLRYSGTEPLLRVMVEARRKEDVDRAVDELVEVAREALAHG